MDPITQALLGSAAGVAVGARRLGAGRAALWGALAGAFPDVDVLLSPLGPFAEMRYHRGLTHGLAFGPVIAPLWGWLVWRWYARRGAAAAEAVEVAEARPGAPDPGGPGALRWWIALIAVAVLTHPLLDACTTYGTQLLAPFSDRGFAFDAVGVIDPAYTAVLALGLVAAAGLRGRGRWQAGAAVAALAVSTGYLGHGYALNEAARAEATRQLHAEGVTPDRVLAYPTLFQPYLRRVVARGPRGDARVGFLSTWRPHPIAWTPIAEAHGAEVEALRSTPEGELFTWFAMRETIARVRPSATERDVVVVEIEDLRYGWPDAPGRALWGIRARVARAVGAAGAPQVVSVVERFHHPRPRDLQGGVVRLFRMALGEPDAFAESAAPPPVAGGG